jgi:acyl transferase domain-containing protein
LDDNYDIAIIGMDGRFPGARSADEFWQNLKGGVESISFFSNDELDIPADNPILTNPAFVKAGGVLENIDLFDASFFNVPAAEAEWMDPQQRLFLECAWLALENAGYNPQTYKGLIAPLRRRQYELLPADSSGPTRRRQSVSVNAGQ